MLINDNQYISVIESIKAEISKVQDTAAIELSRNTQTHKNICAMCVIFIKLL